MSPEEGMVLDDADLQLVTGVIIDESVDRRGNYTCLAVTGLGAMISMGQVAN